MRLIKTQSISHIKFKVCVVKKKNKFYKILPSYINISNPQAIPIKLDFFPTNNFKKWSYLGSLDKIKF